MSELIKLESCINRSLQWYGFSLLLQGCCLTVLALVLPPTVIESVGIWAWSSVAVTSEVPL